jgi:uncharacterized membrane protein YdfJ with MMPL/SSD domain
MFTLKINPVLAALLAATLTLSPVTPTLGRDIQAAPTGDGPAGKDECAKLEKAINSWADAALAALQAGKEKEARKADRNTQKLIDKATDAGCFIIY